MFDSSSNQNRSSNKARQYSLFAAMGYGKGGKGGGKGDWNSGYGKGKSQESYNNYGSKGYGSAGYGGKGYGGGQSNYNSYGGSTYGQQSAITNLTWMIEQRELK